MLHIGKLRGVGHLDPNCGKPSTWGIDLWIIRFKSILETLSEKDTSPAGTQAEEVSSDGGREGVMEG